MIELNAHYMDYPETYAELEFVDSPQLSELARRLMNAISDDFITTDRTLIPGLREALRQLAHVADP